MHSTYVKNNAALNEVVKKDRTLAKPIEFPDQDSHQIIAQPVSERC